MRGLKKKYKIAAIGDIKMRAVQNQRTERMPAQDRDAIDGIWRKTRKESGGKLFNGTVPNLIGVKKNGTNIEITSHFIEYKLFLAHMKRPALKLGIRPIGVSGIIILEDKGNVYTVFAKRSDNVTEYPGSLELVPSGSIDKECADTDGVIDYRSKLLSEFVEETGLSKECVKGVSGFAVVLDINHNVYDICCEIILRAKKEFVEQGFSSKEYNAPVVIAMNDLDGFIKANADSIVPTSLALLEAYRQYKEKQ